MPKERDEVKVHEVLLAIADYLDENDGQGPAYTDLRVTCGSAWYYVRQLEAGGLVTSRECRARSLRLTDQGKAKVEELRKAAG